MLEPLKAEVERELALACADRQQTKRLTSLLVGAMLDDAASGPARARPYDAAWVDNVTRLRSGPTSRLLAGDPEKGILPQPRTPYFVGGSRSEGEWRSRFAAAGIGVSEPPVGAVEVQIDALNEMISQEDAEGQRPRKRRLANRADLSIYPWITGFLLMCPHHPWYWAAKDAWFVETGDTRHRLGQPPRRRARSFPAVSDVTT